MRNFDTDPETGFVADEMDHVAAWLDRRSTVEAWGLVLGSMAVVATLDFSTQPFELCIATLYIVPICLATWMFRARTAMWVTALVTFTAFLKYPLLHAGADVFTTIYNGVTRALAFSLLTAIILAFRRSYDCAGRAARRDRMTGALTRLAFDQRARAMIAAAAQQGRPLLLAYLDLDGFKVVNDRHGHEAGDLVLKHFGMEGRGALRREDCFGRMGGDEFALLMPLATIQDGQKMAEGLHRRFTAALANAAHEVTCSMGALAIPPDRGANLDELLREADRLMYAAKHAGKDGLRFAAATRPFPSSSASNPSASSFGEASEVAGNA